MYAGISRFNCLDIFFLSEFALGPSWQLKMWNIWIGEPKQSVWLTCTEIFRFLPFFQRTVLMKPVSRANENEYSTISSVYMQPCAIHITATWSSLHGEFQLHFSGFSVVLLLLCTLIATPAFANTVFSQPFFLRLCMTSDPPLMLPRTTQSFWMWVRSGDWWERAVMKEFSDGE